MTDYLTMEEQYNHDKIVEHNSKLVNNSEVVYPEDRDTMINELSELLYKVPIVLDEESGEYYQVVEFEDGDERVDIDRKYYPYLKYFM